MRPHLLAAGADTLEEQRLVLLRFFLSILATFLTPFAVRRIASCDRGVIFHLQVVPASVTRWYVQYGYNIHGGTRKLNGK
jgi:hypothetical protein